MDVFVLKESQPRSSKVNNRKKGGKKVVSSSNVLSFILGGALVFYLTNLITIRELLSNKSALELGESERLPTQQNKEGRKRKLGDGCYHVFLDVGANIGVHTRFLYEPQLYPDAETARSLFDAEFGRDRNNLDFCSFGFEPNPNHVMRHKMMERAYKNVGWRYIFVQAAVAGEGGNITFYHNNDESLQEWGFSDHDRADVARRAGNHGFKPGIKESVPAVRLSEWLTNEILDRDIPTTIHGNYTSGPKVVMKMDIESLEFKVLPDIWFTGVLCNTIDYIFGELHDHPIDYEQDKITGKGDLHLGRGESYKFLSTVMKCFNSFKGCKTRIEELDDESYLDDGMPFPNATDKGR
mmetsp:Transcript_4518/g.8398  ORF Transcript_4518/g.8398 Transcript_4518/m.8398 type:complete len:352 (+) Transcript_4518:660-1715(+)